MIAWFVFRSLGPQLQVYTFMCIQSTQGMHVLYRSLHCKKERVVLTDFGHLSYTQNCCKSLNKVYKKAISLSYHKLFTIGVDSLMMLKWSHATDITNMGQFNHHFFTV